MHKHTYTHKHHTTDRRRRTIAGCVGGMEGLCGGPDVTVGSVAVAAVGTLGWLCVSFGSDSLELFSLLLFLSGISARCEVVSPSFPSRSLLLVIVLLVKKSKIEEVLSGKRLLFSKTRVAVRGDTEEAFATVEEMFVEFSKGNKGEKSMMTGSIGSERFDERGMFRRGSTEEEIFVECAERFDAFVRGSRSEGMELLLGSVAALEAAVVTLEARVVTLEATVVTLEDAVLEAAVVRSEGVVDGVRIGRTSSKGGPKEETEDNTSADVVLVMRSCVALDKGMMAELERFLARAAVVGLRLNKSATSYHSLHCCKCLSSDRRKAGIVNFDFLW